MRYSRRQKAEGRGQVLEMADVDVTDIMLAIACSVSESLEAIQINLKPGYFVNLFREIGEILQTPVEISDVEFSVDITKITSKTKDIHKFLKFNQVACLST
ncbi:MAG TPA: hypothetical protein V6D26_29255 [Stenomitos sp.]